MYPLSKVEDEMKDLVLDLVASCENRVTMIEELVTGAHYATATVDASLAQIADERVRLKASLQELLARNCSLRRKDFNLLIERIIAESEKRKRELEEERRRVRDELKGYLDEQKQLVVCLRQQLGDFNYEKGDKDALETTIARIKASYQQKGQEVFSLLRGFQLHLKAFQREQEEMNHELQRLADRGKSLKTEDLRQFEAVKADQERRAEKELRREDVERLLAHFKEQRQGSSRHRR